MSYASNQGIRIYYEVEGQGPPLIMAHGVTRSLDRWRQTGFADALKKDYRLILFDARGHGKSDKPHDPAAYGTNMVNDVLAVLNDLPIDRANYMGYSMGAGVGFALAVRHPARFNSFVLGGWNPYRTAAGVPANPPAAGPGQQIRLLRSDPEAYLRSREQQLGRPLTPDERKAELANDPEAFGALMATFRDVSTFDNQELSRISAPCLLYAGASDPMYDGAKEASTQIPQATFFSLPGLDHVQAGGSPLALPRIKKFLARVSKT